MTQIFLSYARETRGQAGLIAKTLMLEGFRVWWDDDLPVHRSYTDVIADEIRAAGAVTVIWSGAAVASEWVRAEANEGRELKKLVQVLVEDAVVPLPFNQIQVADLRDWNGERDHGEWRKVVQSLAALTAQPTPKTGAEAAAIRHRFAGPDVKRNLAKWALPAMAAAGLLGVGVMVWRSNADREDLARRVVQETLDGGGASGATVNAAPAPGAHPSFDCKLAQSATERFICSDVAVAAAEKTMAVAYRAAQARSKTLPALRSSQREFLVRIAEAPKERATMLALYRARAEELKSPNAGAPPKN
ncbi:MAG TPA: TIR domain-containing protein [Caulobacteraceae bacterium]|nr:TIR domain-containing protein [Caulobacteraceae bacterium]